ncbi:MAG: S-layer homology domain-containing protein, partial [Oscillospiraceae bacterium]|nr:S-layer homology domain-containing protein [Oscillospiraceae bacterium]
DAFDVSEWATSAMQWAVGSGVIGGKTASTLAPKDTATRAEIAVIMMRYMNGRL